MQARNSLFLSLSAGLLGIGLNEPLIEKIMQVFVDESHEP
jgi:hypothetical protein